MVGSTRCLACRVGFCEAGNIYYMYVNSRGKGHKEDFDFEELEAAIELYKEHEEDK